MEKNTALDFLLFDYIGITGKDDFETIVNAAIEKAYIDAASHVLSIEGGNEKAKKKGLKIIRDNIGKKDYYADFDSWHNTLCQDLQDMEEAKSDLSYGVAQKWVNMTLKYLLCINGIIDNEQLKKVTSISDNYHIPIDSYVIEALCREMETDPSVVLPAKRTSGEDQSQQFYCKEKSKIGNNRKPLWEYSAPQEKIQPWSNWDDKDYEEFRKNISKKYNLIWETTTWISVSKKRNG